MQFTALRRAISAADEKQFYDIALLFLRARGYAELKIVDGPGDGGRDVTSGKRDLRIQLSIQAKWREKLNSEAAKTKAAGRSHFIYVTNVSITEAAETAFLADGYHAAGEVEVQIFDAGKIASTLAASTYLPQVRIALGLDLDLQPKPFSHEVALSNVLLFGEDAVALRRATIEAAVKAILADGKPMPAEEVLERLRQCLGVAGIDLIGKGAIDSLRVRNVIRGPASAIQLIEKEKMAAQAIATEHGLARNQDLARIRNVGDCSVEDAASLLDLSIQLVTLKGAGQRAEAIEDLLQAKLAEVASGKTVRMRVEEILPELLTVQRFQYGATVARAFSTNTFDIFQALGQRDSVDVVLDTSVAMPLLLGLHYGFVHTRFSQAAQALHIGHQRHMIPLAVPSSYINEMASHGLKALEYHETYEKLPESARYALEGATNAFVSHHAAISARSKPVPAFVKFLQSFGIVAGRSLTRIENTLTEIAESQGLVVLRTKDTEVDASFRAELARRKPNEPPILVTHDAEVVSWIFKQTDTGYMLASWDFALQEVVSGTSRILVANPAAVADLLATTRSSHEEVTQSMDLRVALIHLEESHIERLARKIEQIKGERGLLLLRSHIDEAREHFTKGAATDHAQLEEIVDQVLEEQGEAGESLASPAPPR